jgi:hypothetical protein
MPLLSLLMQPPKPAARTTISNAFPALVKLAAHREGPHLLPFGNFSRCKHRLARRAGDEGKAANAISVPDLAVKADQ